MKFMGFLGLAVLWSSASAAATEVNVIGLFHGKAVVVVNRGAPRTLSGGESTPEGVVLVSSDSNGAVLEFDGKRETLAMGQHFETAAQTGARDRTVLPADSQGHFLVEGQVNGAFVRFLVDTGATNVLVPRALARRLNIDLANAERGTSLTANGAVTVYRVILDSVTVNGLTLRNVVGEVQEQGSMDVALLGMSFLNRTEMRRDGQSLILTKRY
jgi:aspartyl protease family protein